MQGKIIKGIAGFYYVHALNGELYQCKAKGIFRKEKIKPLVGDNVEIEVTDTKDLEGNIIDILPRKNTLIRPAVANIDQALLIFAISKPEPNFNLLDRFLIMMQQQGLECIICFNKSDMAQGNENYQAASIYENSGCRVLFTSALQKKGMDTLLEALNGKTTALAGPSGVGKSSIVNCIQNNTTMETGLISAKIKRGKHTTRHSELVSISENTYIMDTPGFSSLSLFGLEKEKLKSFYPEFSPYEDKCRFLTCVHINEPKCGVKEAVADECISKIRYDNYVLLYEELKENERRKY